MQPQIIPFNQSFSFDSSTADQYVDLLLNITRKSKQSIHVMNSRLDSIKNKDAIESEKIQNDINNEILLWSQKIKKLGIVPLSLWRVQFPNHSGQQITWEFPCDQVKSFP